MTHKDVTDAIINACRNSTCNCQASDVATCSISNTISQAAVNCSETITSNVYTKNEIDDKMSEVYKTFEKELSAASAMFQTCDIENTHSIKSSIYNVEEKVDKISQNISWIQIQQYTTWLMLVVIGFMIFFKSFDISIDIKNPDPEQVIEIKPSF